MLAILLALTSVYADLLAFVFAEFARRLSKPEIMRSCGEPDPTSGGVGQNEAQGKSASIQMQQPPGGLVAAPVSLRLAEVHEMKSAHHQGCGQIGRLQYFELQKKKLNPLKSLGHAQNCTAMFGWRNGLAQWGYLD
jgi:hypothetical protein